MWVGLNRGYLYLLNFFIAMTLKMSKRVTSSKDFTFGIFHMFCSISQIKTSASKTNLEKLPRDGQAKNAQKDGNTGKR